MINNLLSKTGFRSFTLIEMLITISIVLILAAIVFPAAQRVLHQAKVAKCTSNLRQIGVAMLAYASDNNGYLPPAWDSGTLKIFSTFIEPYIQMDSEGDKLNIYLSPFSKPVTKEPSPGEPYNISYSMHNLLGFGDISMRPKISAVTRPSEVILVCTGVQNPDNYMRVQASFYYPNEIHWVDCPYPLDQAIPTTETLGWPGYINEGRVNCLFVAGNVGSIKKGEVKWRHLLPLRDN